MDLRNQGLPLVLECTISLLYSQSLYLRKLLPKCADRISNLRLQNGTEIWVVVRGYLLQQGL